MGQEVNFLLSLTEERAEPAWPFEDQFLRPLFLNSERLLLRRVFQVIFIGPVFLERQREVIDFGLGKALFGSLITNLFIREVVMGLIFFFRVLLVEHLRLLTQLYRPPAFELKPRGFLLDSSFFRFENFVGLVLRAILPSFEKDGQYLLCSLVELSLELGSLLHLTSRNTLSMESCHWVGARLPSSENL